MSFQNQISPAGRSYAQTMAELIKKDAVELRESKKAESAK